MWKRGRLLLSPRLQLSLRCRQQWLLLWRRRCCHVSAYCSGPRQVFLKPDEVLFPVSGSGWCGCDCFCIRSGGSAVPFGFGWRCSRLWYCVGGFFSAGWASFCVAAMPGSTGSSMRRSPPARVVVLIARPAWSAKASEKRPRDHTPSPVRSPHRREASSRSASESSEEVRVESPPSTAGRSLIGGTPSVSQPASVGDHLPRSGSSGWHLRSSAVADLSRTGIGGHQFPLLRERSTSTTFVPLRPWTSTGMVLSSQSWPSSRPSVAWWNRQASPLLAA